MGVGYILTMKDFMWQENTVLNFIMQCFDCKRGDEGGSGPSNQP